MCIRDRRNKDGEMKMTSFDLLIKNGSVIDGSGRAMFKADVGIAKGKVAQIGKLEGSSADRVIDAKGLFVAPGVVDCHSHSDWSILVHPNGDSKVMQGVTTELGGLCGYACAPLPTDEWWRLLYVRMTVGWSMHYSAAAYNSWPLPYGRQVDVDWHTMGEYLDKVEETRIGLNYAMLFGHGAIRYWIMGLEARPADEEDMSRMKEMADQALRDGAFGMSAGLSGCPGCWASTEELIELCRVVARHDGVYMPHMRMGPLNVSVRESVRIAEEAGVRTCMSHTSLHDAKIRKMVDDARGRGVDITFDYESYAAGIAGNIVGMLPHWLSRRRDEGFDWIIEQLKKPEVRKRFMEKDYRRWLEQSRSIPGTYEHKIPEGKTPQPRWATMQVQKVWTTKNRKYLGKTFKEIADERGVDPWTAWFDIVCDERGYARWASPHLPVPDMASALSPSYMLNNTDFEEELKVPYGCLESDGPIESPRGVTVTSVDPRSYGTFPLALWYVREKKAISWEEAIKRMTSNPAEVLAIRDRGLLREGFWADVMVFDPETIAHKADVRNSFELSQGINHDIYPEGIKYVLVNGEIVVEKGKLTNTMSGQVLRHNK